LVPQLHPIKVLSVAGDHHVEKIRVAFRIVRRRVALGRDAPAWRRVKKTRQHVHAPGELWEEPGVPRLAFRRVPVRPGDAGAKLADTERFKVFEHAVDAIVLTRTEPFEHADRGALRARDARVVRWA